MPTDPDPIPTMPTDPNDPWPPKKKPDPNEPVPCENGEKQ